MLEVLDELGLPTGQRKSRAEVHRDGDWHRTVHIWVTRPEAHVLLQRRADTKLTEPGRLDASVAGHVLAGELSVDLGREAEEEIGLTLGPSQLTFLGTVRVDRRYGDLSDREFQDVYVAYDDRPLGDYLLRDGEVDVLYELPIDRAIELFASGRYVPAPGRDAMHRVNNALLFEQDLPSLGRDSLRAELERVKAFIGGEDPEQLAAQPIG